MKTILFALFILGSNFHDIQVAYYKIHQDDDKLLVKFVFEEDDLIRSMKDIAIDYSAENLKEYIRLNFLLTINNERKDFTFGSIQNSGKHIFIVGTIPENTAQIHSIDISNTCLINIEDHSNIVEVKLNERQRDFLMNLERTSIQIEY